MTNPSNNPAPSLAESFCLTCAYPLHPLERPTGRCPECGRLFDLADLTTFSPAPNHLRFRRLTQSVRRRLRLLSEAYLRAAAKPTRWLWPAAVAVHAVSVVVSILLLGELLWPIFCLGAGLCVIGLAFTPCRIVRRDLGILGKFPADAAMADRAVFRRIRKASLWLTLMLLLRLPFQLFFLISLPVLNDVAHRIDTSPGELNVHFIGLLPVRRQLIGHGGA